MIRLATAEEKNQVLSLCRTDAWNGTAVWCAYLSRCADMHNADWQYSDLWIGCSESQQAKEQYLLCRMGHTYYLVGKPKSDARWKELEHFLSMQPKGKLVSDSRTVWEYRHRFEKKVQGEAVRSGPRMIYKTKIPIKSQLCKATESQSLWATCEVLVQEKQNVGVSVSKDDVAAGMLFQKRGGGKFFEVCKEGRPVSVGGILLPDKGKFGLIIDICTLPEHRNQGYAAQIISKLCMEAEAAGKIPVLDCASQKLEQYYARLGFQTVNFWQSYYC